MLTLIFNWLFRYAEDASFSDCVRAVLPAVLGERGGKGGREKCCVLCCVLCWDACVLCIVLCCVMRAVVLWPSTASYCLLHSFCTASAQLLHSFSAQHELTRSQPPNLPTSQPPNLPTSQPRRPRPHRPFLSFGQEGTHKAGDDDVRRIIIIWILQ